MSKEHVRFHSENGKRLLLIADDERINREILAGILQSDYESLLAEDGLTALEAARAHAETLSLILLDLNMPGMSGWDFLRCVRKDPALSRIPVIVLTADQDAEVESLSLGASDFIPKPYPRADVILARIRRTIELSEDRQIIQSTERDPLTGLYNREYFYRYADQFDQYHRDLPMDVLVIDINHFHMINERFGTAFGDELLRRIGGKLRDLVGSTGGMVCRQEGDTFLVYCPRGLDYPRLLNDASAGLMDDEGGSRVRLRMGVYADADKSLDIERRFDRAKSAADTVRNSFTRSIGVYDAAMHEREVYNEQLIEDFPRAVAERQFQVFYQPKFDVRPEVPVLASAEALVRWKHPTLGMISPGVFIPLFEENGLIQALDQYVWRTAAAQIRDWKRRFDFTVPVSVNVSRIDMYDPNLIGTFSTILAENELTPREFLLEITESAYTQDSEQIIRTVNRLRSLGFRIEMDDFGTGYSSLNMISTLPIDALKLDMQFIRNAFNQRKDTRMLEVIIDIADYLSVPVIAEGVETDEQLNALKAMGCDMVQGYYFSRPIPAEAYEPFVIQRREQDLTLPEAPQPKRRGGAARDAAFGKITCALSSGFESVYYVDTDNDHYVEFSSEGRYEDLQIQRSGADFFADTAANIRRVVYGPDQTRVLLSMSKDTLMSQLIGFQPFSMTYRLMLGGRPAYYNLKAVRTSTHDEHHIVIGIANVDEQIRQAGAAGEEPVDFASLSRALSRDMACIYYVDTESDSYLRFSSDGAGEILNLEPYGPAFFEACREIIAQTVYVDDRDRVAAALEREALSRVLDERPALSMDFRLLMDGKPVYYRLKVIRADQNDRQHIILGICDINSQITEEQRRDAERERDLRLAREAAYRDALTGVKSKHAFLEAEKEWNERIAAGKVTELSVVVCDVNDLKEINDTQGHKAGDQYIRAGSAVICNMFKHSPVYRFGGDEFAAILTGQDFENRAALQARFEQAAAAGSTRVAMGMSDYRRGDAAVLDVFRRADSAMYHRKKELKAAQ